MILQASRTVSPQRFHRVLRRRLHFNDKTRDDIARKTAYGSRANFCLIRPGTIGDASSPLDQHALTSSSGSQYGLFCGVTNNNNASGAFIKAGFEEVIPSRDHSADHSGIVALEKPCEICIINYRLCEPCRRSDAGFVRVGE